MSFIRTVCGDVPVERLGLCYSHEHVVLKGPFIEANFPEFLLEDLDAIEAELNELREAGIGTMIDAMPIDAGRSADDMAMVSKRSGMNIVAATGLHLRQYYPARHWYDTIDEDALTARFIDEIEHGIVDSGKSSNSKAGVIKVAGSLNHLSDLERRNFRAAGQSQRATGCPILTHTEQGTAAIEQIRILQDEGADLRHVVLSHLDRIRDPGYHREALSTGVRLEYDSSFRWKGEENPTFDLILELAPEYPESLVLGMDAAKFAYWSSFGGKPGLAFLINVFAPKLIGAGLPQELLDAIFGRNPAAAYSFQPTRQGGLFE